MVCAGQRRAASLEIAAANTHSIEHRVGEARPCAEAVAGMTRSRPGGRRDEGVGLDREMSATSGRRCQGEVPRAPHNDADVGQLIEGLVAEQVDLVERPRPGVGGFVFAGVVEQGHAA
jgi:hypothetical protein